MTPPRLVMASMLMAGIFAAGTVGYRLVAGANWWDAFYMTVITLTTVGYAEIFPLSRAGEIFTVALLLAGLGMFLLLATDVARTVVEGEIRQVHTVLTARALNPDLFIVARATEEGAERRILQAGADRVVNPYQLGGIRLAHLVAKPAIVNFFDASLGKHEGLQIDQVSVQAGSSLVGQTLLQANLPPEALGHRGRGRPAPRRGDREPVAGSGARGGRRARRLRQPPADPVVRETVHGRVAGQGA